MAQGWGAYNGATSVPWQAVNPGQPYTQTQGLQQTNTWADVPGANAMGHPALPALWWVGLIIVLVAIRVLNGLME